MSRIRSISFKGAILSAALSPAPGFSLADTPAMAQLKLAAQAASSSVISPAGESAASANAKWADDAGERPGAAVSGDYAARAAASPAEARPLPATPPPNLIAVTPDVPDPLPPADAKGWKGFTLGFLGTESKALSLLSGTGKAAIPIMVLLQPLILPAALIAGLLGAFGVRL